jgi:hypothetical protein
MQFLIFCVSLCNARILDAVMDHEDSAFQNDRCCVTFLTLVTAKVIKIVWISRPDCVTSHSCVMSRFRLIFELCEILGRDGGGCEDVLWHIAPCIWWKLTDVSEVPVTSITRTVQSISESYISIYQT